MKKIFELFLIIIVCVSCGVSDETYTEQLNETIKVYEVHEDALSKFVIEIGSVNSRPYSIYISETTDGYLIEASSSGTEVTKEVENIVLELLKEFHFEVIDFSTKVGLVESASFTVFRFGLGVSGYSFNLKYRNMNSTNNFDRYLGDCSELSGVGIYQQRFICRLSENWYVEYSL